MNYLFSSIFLSIFSLQVVAQQNQWNESKRCDASYTFEAYKNKIEGTSYITFMISPEGKILKDSTIVNKGIGFGLDEIAIREVNNMPTWNFPKNEKNASKV